MHLVQLYHYRWKFDFAIIFIWKLAWFKEIFIGSTLIKVDYIGPTLGQLGHAELHVPESLSLCMST